VEQSRKAVQIFLLIRKLKHTLTRAVDTELPQLAGQSIGMKEEQNIELGGRDCLACTRPRDQKNKNSSSQQLYLVLDSTLLLLAEPNTTQSQTGIARSVAPLHHVDVSGDMISH
jgi:hypothetical protein